MNDGFSMSNLLYAVPHVLGDDNGLAPLITVLAEAAEEVCQCRDLPIVFPRIEDLPEGVLDMLAKDMKVDWYNFDWGIEAKRQTIKDAFYVHRHLGTVGAVKRALTDVWPPSTVEEWFEYGGDPFYFRAILEATQQRETISLPGVLKAISLFKAARAKLQDDMVIVSITCNVVIRTQIDGQYYLTRITGTYPRIATHGNVTEEQIIVATEESHQTYRPPAAGEIVTGTHPRTATHGNVSAGEVIVETEEAGQTFRPPAAGEIVTGVYPIIASRGNADEGGMDISVSSGGAEYQTPRCGDKLWRL